MKIYLFIVLYAFLIFSLSAQGITKYGQSTTTSTNFVNKNGQIGSSITLSKYGQGITVSLPATISTSAVIAITGSGMISGGNVTNDGGSTVTARGVCWNTAIHPTVSNSKTTNGTGTGAFVSGVSGLAKGTTYYVRSYATNSWGTSYGTELMFTTIQLSIGDSYQGGKVAYILQPGDTGYIEGTTQGLIAALADQSASAPWGGTENNFAGTVESSAIGTGNYNTTTILAWYASESVSTTGIAARICSDLVIPE